MRTKAGRAQWQIFCVLLLGCGSDKQKEPSGEEQTGTDATPNGSETTSRSGESETESQGEEKNADSSSETGASEVPEFEASLMKWEEVRDANDNAYRYSVVRAVPLQFENNPYCELKTTIQVYQGEVVRRELKVTKMGEPDEIECPWGFVEEGTRVGESREEGVAPVLSIDQIYQRCREDLLNSEYPWGENIYELEVFETDEEGLLSRCGWIECDDGGCQYGSPYFEILDLSWLPPKGVFACGENNCDLATEYCESTVGGRPPEPGEPADNSKSCKTLPDECVLNRTCECLSEILDVCDCEIREDGSVHDSCILP